MKKERMNISHSRFSLFKLKIFGEIVTTFINTDSNLTQTQMLTLKLFPNRTLT